MIHLTVKKIKIQFLLKRSLQLSMEQGSLSTNITILGKKKKSEAWKQKNYRKYFLGLDLVGSSGSVVVRP